MARLLLLALLLLPSLASAQSIVLRTNTLKLSEGGQSSLEVVVTGELQGSLTLPNSEQLEFIQTSQQVEQTIGRGGVLPKYTIGYRVLAKAPGTVKVGPVRAMVSGRMRRSNQLEYTVVTAGAAAKRARAVPEQARQADWYALASVSDDTPYVGQSIVYTMELGTAVRHSDAGWGPPNAPALVDEPGIEQTRTERIEVQDGRRTTVYDFHRAMFALEPGPVNLKPATAGMTVLRGRRSIINFGEQERFSSNPVQLEVKPLPTRGRPEGFRGAVGRFGLTATVDQTTVDAGETITLEVRVAGEGGLRNVELPITVPDGLKIYDADPEQNSMIIDGSLRSEAIYRKTLVPLHPGPLQLPPVTFDYFDPTTGKYRTARTKAIALTVTGEAVMDTALLSRSASLGTGKEQVEVLGADILPLHGGSRMLGDARLSVLSPVVLALLVLPLLGFGALFGQATQQRRAGTDAGQERQRKKDAKGAAGQARAAAKDGDWEAAEAAVRGFLTAKLERSGSAIAPSEAASILADAGAPAGLGPTLAALLERAEAARYGGGSTANLADALADWVADAQGSWR